MAQPTPLQTRFDGGMKPDLSRDQLPPNAVYNMVDYFPDLDAPLRKRGGWGYEGALLTDLYGLAGNIRHVAYAPFSPTAQVVALDDSANRLFDLTNGVDRGAAQNHAQAPIFYRNKLIIGTTFNSGATPLKYTGGAPAALGGSPPAMATFCVYKDRLLGSSSTSGVDSTLSGARFYFSGTSEPEVWDTTNSFFDTSAGIVAMAALSNGVLIFHAGSVEIFRADKFPSVTNPLGEGVELKPLFNDVGIHGPNSFATDGHSVYWADEAGVYMTDGSALTDLTKEGDIKNYFRVLMSSVGASGFCAVGWFNGYVWVSLLNSSRAQVATLLCDPKKRSWLAINHVNAKNFAPRYGTEDAFWFSNQVTKRAGELSSVFLRLGSESDATGLDITPELETGYYTLGSQGLKRWRHVYVGYDLRDAASDDPALSLHYITSPEATTYSSALSPSLGETEEYERKRIPIELKSRGIGLQLLQFAASGASRVYSIEADVRPLEPSRR